MKRVEKSAEPQSLADFRAACPDANWDQMRNDALHNGQQVYADCRSQTGADQRGLCAYCEIRLNENQPHKWRVEHIHPKSDTSSGRNWNLDWQNLLSVCNGGESEGCAETPLPENLSCDASKKDSLLAVSPLDIPAFPNVFAFDKANWHLHADSDACAAAGLDVDKLEQSIEMLKLNCSRLARLRSKVLVDIDKRKKRLRVRGYTPKDAIPILAKGLFQAQWPEFFTTIRCCLGPAAEEYLHSINYKG